jgi:hypothetical protein
MPAATIDKQCAGQGLIIIIKRCFKQDAILKQIPVQTDGG